MHVEAGGQEHPAHALLAAGHGLRDALDCAVVANSHAALGQPVLRMPEAAFQNHASASGSSDSRSV